VQAAREAARRGQCSNNLHQLGIAMHHYVDRTKVLPLGIVASPLAPPWPAQPGHTALAQLLPFLEQSNVHTVYDFKLRNVAATNKPATSTQIPAFQCPSDNASGRKAVFKLGSDTELSRSNLAVCFGSNTFVRSSAGRNIGTEPDRTGVDTNTDGAFRLDIVEITSLGKTGRKTRAESGALVDMEGQVLPARYNTKSTLQAHVKPGQRNEFPFEVTSK